MKFLGRLLDRLSWPVLLVAGVVLAALMLWLAIAMQRTGAPARDVVKIIVGANPGVPTASPPPAEFFTDKVVPPAPEETKPAPEEVKPEAAPKAGKTTGAAAKSAITKSPSAAASAPAAPAITVAPMAAPPMPTMPPGIPEGLEARIRKRVHDELARVQGELERSQAEAMRGHEEKRREAEQVLRQTQQDYEQRRRDRDQALSEASREYGERVREIGETMRREEQNARARDPAQKRAPGCTFQDGALRCRLDTDSDEAQAEAAQQLKERMREMQQQQKEALKDFETKRKEIQKELRNAQTEAQNTMAEASKEIARQVAILGDGSTYKVPEIRIPEINIPEFRFVPGATRANPAAPAEAKAKATPEHAKAGSSSAKSARTSSTPPPAPPAAPAADAPPAAPEAPTAPPAMLASAVPAAPATPAAPLAPSVAPLSRDAMMMVERDVGSAVASSIGEEVHSAVKDYRIAIYIMLIGMLLLLFSGAVVGKMVIASSRAARTRAELLRVEAERNLMSRQVVEAQLKMMQAQIEPHFLFNTLANVRFLMEGDAGSASTMLDHLIEYLHAALPQMRENSTTLGRECELARAYLEILKIRMGHRLQFAIHVPEQLQGVSLPPMMLLSLVENAIKHGLEPMREGGRLDIEANADGGTLRVAVRDTGAGLGESSGAQAGTGVGLANIRDRLKTLYGERARLTLTDNPPRGVVATIEIPHEQSSQSTAR